MHKFVFGSARAHHIRFRRVHRPLMMSKSSRRGALALDGASESKDGWVDRCVEGAEYSCGNQDACISTLSTNEQVYIYIYIYT